MYCQSCGSEISSTSQYCPICGHSQERHDVIYINGQEGSLLDRMKVAQHIIHEIPMLQKEMDDLSYQIESQKDKYVEQDLKKWHKARTIIIAILLASLIEGIWSLLIYDILSPQGIPSQFLNLVGEIGAFLIIIGAIVWVMKKKKDNENENEAIKASNFREQERVKTQNAEVEASSVDIRKQIKEKSNLIFAVQEQWLEQCAPWYPVDYIDIASVDFFVSALQNKRADSVKEVVNLWEHEKHMNTAEAQRAEMNAQQAKMLTQQKISNMLSVGSLLIQGQLLSNAKDIKKTVGDIDLTTRRIEGIAEVIRNNTANIASRVR